MNNKLQIRRTLLLLGFLGVVFVGLGYRLVDLQVLRHDELSARAQRNTQREFRQAPRRGNILDANGETLATSIPVKTICADPSLMGSQSAAVAHVLAPMLQFNEVMLAQKLAPRTYITKSDEGETITNELHYVRLAKNVPEESWQQIYGAMTNLTFGVDEKKLTRTGREFFRNLRLHSVYAEAGQMRVYPNGRLAGQVVGFPAIEETNVNGRFVSKIVGIDGIEKSMEKQLSGVAGWRVTETDKAQREIVAGRDENVFARDGLDVVLTIDTGVQHIVETALADALQKHTPKSITGIVLRPRTGEILAMVSLPNYDPNQPNTITPETRNRVIVDAMEPGSAFKIVVVSGALNRGVVGLDDQFDCEHGQFIFAGITLHDHDKHGILKTWEIIMHSSNIGAAKIGIKLGEKSLYDYAWNYGFGQRTGIPLPGEVRGVLHPVTNWTKVSIAQIPMGQGVSVTRLQMAMAMGAIANGGWLMRPMIVSQLQQRDGTVVQRYAPEPIRQVVSEAADKQMIEALKTVVTKDGTAPGAAMKNYVVAGKTGTAQTVVDGKYSHDQFMISFIGFFPADKPKICISVVMDSPKEGGHAYGGALCGPVFREILRSVAQVT